MAGRKQNGGRGVGGGTWFFLKRHPPFSVTSRSRELWCEFPKIPKLNDTPPAPYLTNEERGPESIGRTILVHPAKPQQSLSENPGTLAIVPGPASPITSACMPPSQNVLWGPQAENAFKTFFSYGRLSAKQSCLRKKTPDPRVPKGLLKAIEKYSDSTRTDRKSE